MKLKRILAALTVALFAPLAASAATVTSNGVTGDPLSGVGVIDVLAGGSYGIEFDDPLDTAGELNFELWNNSGSAVWVQITTTINQGDGFGFADGVEAWLAGGMSMFAQGEAGFTQVLEVVGANSFINYDLAFGDPQSNGFADPFINVVVIGEVPVPAASFLLIGALGGLIAVRRRKA